MPVLDLRNLLSSSVVNGGSQLGKETLVGSYQTATTTAASGGQYNQYLQSGGNMTRQAAARYEPSLEQAAKQITTILASVNDLNAQLAGLNAQISTKTKELTDWEAKASKANQEYQKFAKVSVGGGKQAKMRERDGYTAQAASVRAVVISLEKKRDSIVPSRDAEQAKLTVANKNKNDLQKAFDEAILAAQKQDAESAKLTADQENINNPVFQENKRKADDAALAANQKLAEVKTAGDVAMAKASSESAVAIKKEEEAGQQKMMLYAGIIVAVIVIAIGFFISMKKN